MKQKIIFQTNPTTNPEKYVDHARHVINDSTGLGTDVLKKVLEENLPIVHNEETVTGKEVLHISRYECPCCPIVVEALIRVRCAGLVTKETPNVSGLYKVIIYSNNYGGKSKVCIEKLSGTTIYEGRTDFIPKKRKLFSK